MPFIKYTGYNILSIIYLIKSIVLFRFKILWLLDKISNLNLNLNLNKIEIYFIICILLKLNFML